MLAFVLLFTIFIGLVGLLAVIGECQKRLRSSQKSTSTSAGSTAADEVTGWLSERDLPTPTTQQVISLLNDSLQAFSFKEWKEMKLQESSHFPHIQVSSVSLISRSSIQFLCKFEDLPEMSVVCCSKEGETIVCRLAMEWLYALVQVTLTQDNGNLLFSVEHNEPVRMSFCCAAQDNVKDGERLASSVADELQMWFEGLYIDSTLIGSPVPSLVVSDHDVAGPDSLEVGFDSPEPRQLSCSPNSLPSDSIPVEKPAFDLMVEEEAVSESPSSPVFEEDEEGADIIVQEEMDKRERTEEAALERDHVIEASRPAPLSAVAEEEEEGREADKDLTLSPTWRRSPSYEQLQQIELDPQRLLQSSGRRNHMTPPHLAGADKRALTLSVSGSEAESVYGADDRIPSTLVYEIKDPNNKVRHIVAVTPAHAVKLRRRYPHAKKLHIYNDHCFTATHIKKRTECSVCGSKISGLFGKQAYACQDCSCVVHKHCHFKVEGQCADSSLHQMNLIYPDNTSTTSAN